MRDVSGRKDVYVLPNGDQPARVAAAHPPRRRRRAPLRVTTVMRFTKRKSPHAVVRAIPKINALLPEGMRPMFTLVGDGPERARVEREIARLGVASQVELTGFRPRHEIREILARSSLFILPTSKEALSIATLEARCCGPAGGGDEPRRRRRSHQERPRRLPRQHARGVHRAHRRGRARRGAARTHERGDQAQPRLVRLGLGDRAAHARLSDGLAGVPRTGPISASGRRTRPCASASPEHPRSPPSLGSRSPPAPVFQPVSRDTAGSRTASARPSTARAAPPAA